LKKKSDLKEKIAKCVQECLAKEIKVKCVRCDDAIENKALVDHCNQIGINVFLILRSKKSAENWKG
jgi:hypothetical protein